MIDFAKLSAPFPADQVSWRVGPTKGDKTAGLALAYIDARDVQDRLDEVCTPAGWQCRYTPMHDKKTVCEIGIKVGDEWIWKADGAGDTDMEAEKGSLSDAFKRAAVRWGVGRYLYDVKSSWVEIEKAGNSYKIKDSEYNKLRAILGGKKIATPPAKPASIAADISERQSKAIAWAEKSIIAIAKMDAETLRTWSNTNHKYIVDLKAIDEGVHKRLIAALQDRDVATHPKGGLLENV